MTAWRKRSISASVCWHSQSVCVCVWVLNSPGFFSIQLIFLVPISSQLSAQHAIFDSFICTFRSISSHLFVYNISIKWNYSHLLRQSLCFRSIFPFIFHTFVDDGHCYLSIVEWKIKQENCLRHLTNLVSIKHFFFFFRSLFCL